LIVHAQEEPPIGQEVQIVGYGVEPRAPDLLAIFAAFFVVGGFAEGVAVFEAAAEDAAPEGHEGPADYHFSNEVDVIT